MSRYKVWVHWTGWLGKDSPYMDRADVLYMYATTKEPLWIGEAGNQTVKQRLAGHKTDGVIAWIKNRKNVVLPVRIKIGEPTFEPGDNFSVQKLHDIQTLLIYVEHNKRGFCRANVASTKTREASRPGMIVLNRGKHSPLLKEYHDER